MLAIAFNRVWVGVGEINELTLAKIFVWALMSSLVLVVSIIIAGVIQG